ncbi:MAG: low specificity L-threonine aldolase [Lachnospiraceae bacterium]|nr:low specificity L-threonine aldolase [Lachnospiraceae bacterium]
MVSFASDYIAGAHPAVLKRLVETNLETLPGYGTDEYCASAAEKIKKACGLGADADVYFISGGTQTNQIVISTMLKGYEGVICADTGHINAHEAGAIEYFGVKALPLKGEAGKITAAAVDEYCKTFYGDDNHEHMAFPGMVYISFPTEYGTICSKKELSDLYEVCKKHDMKLFIDGARLAYGLESKASDVNLRDIATLCDVFYIGGTKCGALCGEAVVFTGGCCPKHFVNLIKKRGALLAKGRLLGVQFDALFTDDLYTEIGRYAIDMAEKLKKIFVDKGYRFFLESPTNQQFVILDNKKLKELEKQVSFGFWEKYSDTETVVRFATSWSTTEEDLKYLESII